MIEETGNAAVTSDQVTEEQCNEAENVDIMKQPGVEAIFEEPETGISWYKCPTCEAVSSNLRGTNAKLCLRKSCC